MDSNSSQYTLSLDTIPSDVRTMIWDMVLDGTETRIGPFGPQEHGRTVIRRWISDGSLPSGAEHYPHPLGFVNRSIAGEFREHLKRALDITLVVHPRVRHLPSHIFHHVVDLSISMRQATECFRVVVPRVPAHQDTNPPDTPLTVADCPSLQHLHITWETTPSLSSIGDQDRAAVVIARLSYFRRSFQATIHVKAFKDGRLFASGDLLDHASELTFAPENTTAENYLFRLRLSELKWSPLSLRRPLTLPYSIGRRAIVEAHPFYRTTILGNLYATGCHSPGWNPSEHIDRPYDP